MRTLTKDGYIDVNNHIKKYPQDVQQEMDTL